VQQLRRSNLFEDNALGYGWGVAPDDLDLDAVRAELTARRDHSRQRLGVLAQRPELGSAVGFGKRIGDGTSEAVSRLTDIGVGESLERGLERTERALSKLDEGTYGICDVCGRPITPGRLKAMPDGVLCLDCSASERRVRPPRRR
jgi:DnaK suppressor protein